MTNTKNLAYLLIGFSLILLFVLTFVKSDIDNQSAFLCEKFHENQLDMQQCPAHKSNVSWLMVAAFGIAFLILGTGIYMLFARKQPEEPKKDFRQIDLARLSDDEKKIYDAIKSKDGSAYQSDLIKETGFSKVKITRVLDRLEAKGAVERKRRGMTNIVVLK